MVFMSPAAMSCKSGGKWVRPGGDVPATEAGVQKCAAICKSKKFKYFGLECPGRLAGHKYPPAMVHCQCANDLAGSKKLGNDRCDRKIVSNTHCVGPFKAGPYMLGSHSTGSVYMVDPKPIAIKPPVKPPVVKPPVVAPKPPQWSGVLNTRQCFSKPQKSGDREDNPIFYFFKAGLTLNDCKD